MTKTIDGFVEDVKKQGFRVEKGRHASSLYDGNLPHICVGTVRDDGVILAATPSLASSRAKLRELAGKYGLPVESASAVGNPELGPGTDYLR